LPNAGAPKAARFEEAVNEPRDEGVGREEEWVGLFVGREDFRDDSVRSEMSDVSICAILQL
jgi:hypothetical protein